MDLILNDRFFMTAIAMFMFWGLRLWVTPKDSRWSKGSIAGTLLIIGTVGIYALLNWTTLFWNEYTLTGFPESLSYPRGWNVRVLGDSEVVIWQEAGSVRIKKLTNQVTFPMPQEIHLTELIQEIPDRSNLEVLENSISDTGTTAYANCVAMTQSFNAGLNRTPFIKGKVYAVQCDSGLYTVWADGNYYHQNREVAFMIAETNIANLR